jgi:hypothetical protein
MYTTLRTHDRPPWIRRMLRIFSLSSAIRATPTSAAIRCRSSRPSSGNAASSYRLTTGPNRRSPPSVAFGLLAFPRHETDPEIESSLALSPR